jgi:hypothetical protein
MQDWVRQELRDLGITDATIDAWIRESDTVTDLMKRGAAQWRKDAGRGELVIEWASYDCCHEIWCRFERRYPARAYVSAWQLTHEYHLTPKQRQLLGPWVLSASAINARDDEVETHWWTREQVEAARQPTPHRPGKALAQGELF